VYRARCALHGYEYPTSLFPPFERWILDPGEGCGYLTHSVWFRPGSRWSILPSFHQMNILIHIRVLLKHFVPCRSGSQDRARDLKIWSLESARRVESRYVRHVTQDLHAPRDDIHTRLSPLRSSASRLAFAPASFTLRWVHTLTTLGLIFFSPASPSKWNFKGFHCILVIDRLIVLPSNPSFA
jgi:hypothetical protein